MELAVVELELSDVSSVEISGIFLLLSFPKLLVAVLIKGGAFVLPAKDVHAKKHVKTTIKDFII